MLYLKQFRLFPPKKPVFDTFSYKLFYVVFPIPTLRCGCWRGSRFSTLHSMHCKLLCFIQTSYLGSHWPGLTHSEYRFSCGLVPPEITASFLAWRQCHSSQFKYCALCNTAPAFLAKTSPSCVRTLLTSVYIMDSSSRKGHLLC